MQDIVFETIFNPSRLIMSLRPHLVKDEAGMRCPSCKEIYFSDSEQEAIKEWSHCLNCENLPERIEPQT